MSLLLILRVALMDSAVCSPSWRTLSDDIILRKGARKALKIEMSEKNPKAIEENHQEFSLSCRTSCLSENHYFAGPFLRSLKILFLVHVHSQ